MTPIIEHLPPCMLVGMHRTMSLANDATAQLWRSFMPRRNEVQHRISSDYISMRSYLQPPSTAYLPEARFERWAAVEVSDSEPLPPGMSAYTLTGGLYAVFIHHGPASTFGQTMQAIFQTWLPDSGYQLDHREFFERLPEDYNPQAADAQEEVWIPIKPMG